MFFDNFLPFGHYIFIITHENVERIELDHFLKADNNDIGFIDGKMKQSIEISNVDFIRIDSIAIPSEYICDKFLIGAIFILR